jgi:hypothetical protein
MTGDYLGEGLTNAVVLVRLDLGDTEGLDFGSVTCCGLS